MLRRNIPESQMPPTTSAAAQAFGRLLLAVIFLLSGYAKITNPTGTIAAIGAIGVPYPEIGYYLAVLVEFGGGLLILLGLQTRLAALALAGFCIATGLLVHYHPGNQGQMTHFLKNLAMAGGFLQLFAVGAGLWSLDAVIGRRKI